MGTEDVIAGLRAEWVKLSPVGRYEFQRELQRTMDELLQDANQAAPVVRAGMRVRFVDAGLGVEYEGVVDKTRLGVAMVAVVDVRSPRRVLVRDVVSVVDVRPVTIRLHAYSLGGGHLYSARAGDTHVWFTVGGDGGGRVLSVVALTHEREEQRAFAMLREAVARPGEPPDGVVVLKVQPDRLMAAVHAFVVGGSPP